MDVQAAKIELAKLILGIENPTLILRIKELLTEEITNTNSSLSPQEQNEIKLGLSQLDQGQRISFDDFLDKVS